MAHHGESEADKNYDAFMSALPAILPNHAGKFALLRREQIVGFYETSLAAALEGMQKFGQGEYSVQEVSAEPEHLGFYSYVGGAGVC
jgi:hypothetical protein